MRLNDMATFITDGTHITPNYVESGVPFLSSQNINELSIDFDNISFITEEEHQQLFKCQPCPNDLLISKSGRIGSCAVVPSNMNRGDFNIYEGIAIVRLKDEYIPNFVATFLNSQYGYFQIQRGIKGISQPHLHVEDIRELTVPIPSVDLQKKIANIVQKMNERLSLSMSLYADAENLLTSELGLDKLDLSESLFTVKNVSQVSESHRADAEYYKRKYYNLLGHIEKKKFSTLEQISSFSGGATPLGADYLEEGIPFLRIQNVGDNRLVLDDVVFVDENIHEGLLKRSQIKPNDVLLTITGRIGTSAVVSDDVKTGNINQHIVRMRLNSKEFNPYYLAAFMNSVGGRLQTERESYGTTRDALPYYCLAKIRVLHADMKLQKEIEDTIRKADETHQEAKRLLAEAKSAVEGMIEG